SVSPTPIGAKEQTVTQQLKSSQPAATANVPVTPQGPPPPFIISPRGEHRSRWLKILIYGRTGAGKTTLAASAVDVPSMRDVLMIDAESGDMTVDDNPRIQNAEEIEHIRITEFKQVARIQEFLKSHCQFRDANNVDKMRHYEAWLKGVSQDEIPEPRRF